ncbi:MAG: ABC transporter permease, partial [Planctomycetes bacterium]|nr:ABC transporter permease [Planctomycetota bacterium]
FIDGMTAVFLGALVVKAGKPNVIGTFIGAIFLAVLTNGLTPIGLEDYVGSMIKGVLMILGVVIIAISKYRGVRKKAAVVQ